MKFFAILRVCAVLSLPAVAAAQNPNRALLPAHPAELLNSLPPVEKGWTLTESDAEHVIHARPMARAIREYTRGDAASGGGGQPPAQPLATPGTPPISSGSATATTAGTPAASGTPVPVKVKITLVDVGDNASLASNFGEGGERVAIGAIRAIRVKTPSETDHVECVLLNRFLVTVSITGQSALKADYWIEKINQNALQALIAKSTYFNPKQDLTFVKERVDELNPRRTKKVTWSFAPEIDPASR